MIHAKIKIEGVVDKPDVIGAIFGQTEGLLGNELELRELQRSGRIGRIEVELDTKGGKTTGEILIPSSLDKAETSIVAAALEIIQRIGPCNAKTTIDKMEDIRVSKRQQVVDRAKQLLKDLMEGVLPDSQEIAEEVAHSVRVMEIQEYGKERLPAGPGIRDNEEVMVVEGRADVLTLLKHGFKNAISMNGTSVPETIKRLSKEKIITVFVDGDRGGDLIIKELLGVAEIDFVTKAPDGKEVEELTKKEIHKALRGKIAAEQAKLEFGTSKTHGDKVKKSKSNSKKSSSSSKNNRDNSKSNSSSSRSTKKKLSDEEKEKFSEMLDDLIGTRGAYVLDENLDILGKVPVSELQSTIKSLRSGIYAVVLDGVIDKDFLSTSERADIKFLVARESKAKSNKLTIVTSDDL